MSALDRAIVDVVRSVGASVLGVDIAVISDPGSPLGPGLAGCVEIAGAWSGSVTLRCDDGFAQACAEILFDGEPCGDAEARDTLGELTNMVAGNLKALLPGPSHLSLPTVATGAGRASDGRAGLALENVHFQLSSGHRLEVVVRATGGH